jgi:hypothetical protein
LNYVLFFKTELIKFLSTLQDPRNKTIKIEYQVKTQIKPMQMDQIKKKKMRDNNKIKKGLELPPTMQTSP